jgi:uncharacterized protein
MQCLRQDSENNTILMILSDLKSPHLYDYSSQLPAGDINGAALRMARLYYDRYPWILDWSNVHGKTALHIAALKGNEELVRVCPEVHRNRKEWAEMLCLDAL